MRLLTGPSDETKKEEIGTKEAEQQIAAALNEAAHKVQRSKSDRATSEPDRGKRMPTTSRSKPGKKAPRSRKGPAQLGAKEQFRFQERRDRHRQREHERDRPDRGGPQGRKDKDFQRKF
jgi:hypothetical protein